MENGCGMLEDVERLPPESGAVGVTATEKTNNWLTSAVSLPKMFAGVQKVDMVGLSLRRSCWCQRGSSLTEDGSAIIACRGGDEGNAAVDGSCRKGGCSFYSSFQWRRSRIMGFWALASGERIFVPSVLSFCPISLLLQIRLNLRETVLGRGAESVTGARRNLSCRHKGGTHCRCCIVGEWQGTSTSQDEFHHHG
ncbi:hypothetical protein MLD38_035478 [Melastoma candidum]|uniref:Uncharacterized protein n=1 Tax=Melastoma candidum TaxID=119954 RepID=A0ACB9LII9_9MYRT|nr:hypothetical protein MLD38_035478 [Melastoma candidum]